MYGEIPKTLNGDWSIDWLIDQDLKRHLDDYVASRKIKNPSATGGLPGNPLLLLR